MEMTGGKKETYSNIFFVLYYKNPVVTLTVRDPICDLGQGVDGLREVEVSHEGEGERVHHPKVAVTAADVVCRGVVGANVGQRQRQGGEQDNQGRQGKEGDDLTLPHLKGAPLKVI